MSKPLLAPVLAVALAISLGGCVSLLPKTAPAQLYRFGVDVSAATAPQSASVSGAFKTGVVLGTIGFPRASTSDGILTVTGDETAYLGGVRWVAPARQLFTEAMQRAFDERSKQAQLVNVGDVGPAGAILRVDVTSFEARYDRPGRAPAVVVSLAARLTRSDGRLLDQRDFSVSKSADANSVSSIVKAFDEATEATLGEVTDWTDGQVATLSARETVSPTTVITTSTTVSTPHR